MLAFVVLLGFTALAIDGGMVYADRRHAQNGADASSLAGGGAAALYMENNYVDYEDFSCDPNNYPDGYETWQAQNLARAAAISRAGDNDFTIDEDVSDNNGVVNELRHPRYRRLDRQICRHHHDDHRRYTNELCPLHL